MIIWKCDRCGFEIEKSKRWTNEESHTSSIKIPRYFEGVYNRWMTDTYFICQKCTKEFGELTKDFIKTKEVEE